MLRSFSISLPVALLSICLSIVDAFAQPELDRNEQRARTGEADEKHEDEVDMWRSSLLGINLSQDERGIYVSKIQPGASEGGFQMGDRVLRIGQLDFSKDGLDTVRDMMSQTPPGTRIPISVVRDNTAMESKAISFRPELIDIETIDLSIQKNSIIKAHLAARGKIDLLSGLKTRMVDAVNRCVSPRGAQESLNKIIDELDLSHSAYVPACSYRTLTSDSTGDVGLTLRRFSIDGVQGYFVIDLKPGSAASQSSLRLGDRVEAINGTAIEDSRRVVLVGEEQRYDAFGCNVEIGERIQIQHRHTGDGELKSVSIQATDAPSVKSIMDASVRVFESSGTNVGYIRLWNLMALDTGKAFRDHLESDFSNCDALVVDLRGRGGQIAVVLQIEKIIRKLEIPVVLITDELTRSAKEILAFRLKRLTNVFVIGERTSGAVTGAGFVTLPSGNTLMIPVQSSESLKVFVDGVILEGVGVEPDEQVDFFEPFCNGLDRLLEAAIKRAPERIIN